MPACNPLAATEVPFRRPRLNAASQAHVITLTHCLQQPWLVSLTPFHFETGGQTNLRLRRRHCPRTPALASDKCNSLHVWEPALQPTFPAHICSQRTSSRERRRGAALAYCHSEELALSGVEGRSDEEPL